MSETLPVGTIIFDNVSKRYRLGTFGSLRGTLAALRSRPVDGDNLRRTLWALRDVSFRVEQGTALGVIGPNGAGKTTTLKLLSNITRPSKGHISISGRVSVLIELGAGFHPELTGRENIHLNGAILGMKRGEIARKIDDIIAFAELERSIDTPVKRYSSGMYVRLGFAIAAHVEPDILLVDEVLAVGDASFRRRCTQRMREMQRNGTTVVFVSHNMHQVRNTCDGALLLIQGQIRMMGTPDDVIAEYERTLLSNEVDYSAIPLPSDGFHMQVGLVLKAIEINGSGLATDHLLRSEQSATLRITYQSAHPQPIGRIDIRILREDGLECSVIDSRNATDNDQPLQELADSGVLEVTYDPLQLATGRYSVLVEITDLSDEMVIASGQSPNFEVYAVNSPPGGLGVYVPHTQWKHHADI